MELKEYFKILKENFKLFVFVIALIMVGAFAFFSLKPITYLTSLGLNITRSGAQQTPDYKYDDFYRLQADEKFAETVVQWLQNPRIVADIYGAAGLDASQFTIRQLSKSFGSEKLSSQVVAVNFTARSVDSAKKISNAISDIISKNTENLNKNQNESTWFEVVSQDPIIVRDNVSLLVLFFASLALGIFLGFWAVMLKHYLK